MIFKHVEVITLPPTEMRFEQVLKSVRQDLDQCLSKLSQQHTWEMYLVAHLLVEARLYIVVLS